MAEPNYLSFVLIGIVITDGMMGLFPLIVGLLLRRHVTGIIGFIACIAIAMVGFFASFLMSLGFTTYIAYKVRDERKQKVEEIYST